MTIKMLRNQYSLDKTFGHQIYLNPNVALHTVMLTGRNHLAGDNRLGRLSLSGGLLPK
jgi:hypothetical protein